MEQQLGTACTIASPQFSININTDCYRYRLEIGLSEIILIDNFLVCGETFFCSAINCRHRISLQIHRYYFGEEVDLSHTDKAVELGKLIPGSVFAESKIDLKKEIFH